MNAPALLDRARASSVAHWRAGQPAHVVNLTLLPLTPEDQRLLDQRARRRPRWSMLSRGYGNCRDHPTRACATSGACSYFNSHGHDDPEHDRGRRRCPRWPCAARRGPGRLGERLAEVLDG
ncbi:MAG: hydrogenase expression/formation protein [Comamonadaceae bacterium]|nr:hydrogenase expression/formation protein [Comamonadaceae bacterium]